MKEGKGNSKNLGQYEINSSTLVRFVDVLHKVDINSVEAKKNEKGMETDNGFVFYNFATMMAAKMRPSLYKQMMMVEGFVKRWSASRDKEKITKLIDELHDLRSMIPDVHISKLPPGVQQLVKEILSLV